MRFWTTFFTNVFAQSLQGEDTTLDELGDMIRSATAPAKEAQPLLKLARYGAQRSPAGALRHDGNVIAVSGVEIDYDREEMPLAEACARLDALGLSYLAYTTACHTHSTPRWRWVKQGYARVAKRRGKFFQALVDHLENAPLWKGAVRFNRFAGTVEVCDPFPPQPGQTVGVYRALRDPADTLETLISVQSDGFPTASKTTVFDALFLAAVRHACHPVRDWLGSLEWDGEERLNRLFIDYIPGTVPDRDKDPDRHDRIIAYLENVGSCFPIGAVARIFQPGCKLDTLPLLVSPQNYNKSKALAAFVPDPAWFTDDVPVNVADKDAKLALDGKWIIELAEFPQIRREVDHVKAFFSRPTDRYRPPYARTVGDWPRQCVFIASVNELELPDVTGNRRFWPVLLAGPVKDRDIERDRDQLWAEAVHWYRAGNKWWLSPRIEVIAGEMQDDFVEPDVRDEPIAAWIDMKFPTKDAQGQPIPASDRQIRFTVRQILEGALGFAIVAKDELRSVVATASDEKRVIRRLRRLGYHPDPHRSRTDGQKRFWVPVGS